MPLKLQVGELEICPCIKPTQRENSKLQFKAPDEGYD